MEQVRQRLEAFSKRKSMRPMAERLGVNHQQLEQIVTSSTWDYVDVRKRVAGVEELRAVTD
jgi:DDE superfamily endonuclease